MARDFAHVQVQMRRQNLRKLIVLKLQGASAHEPISLDILLNKIRAEAPTVPDRELAEIMNGMLEIGLIRTRLGTTGGQIVLLVTDPLYAIENPGYFRFQL